MNKPSYLKHSAQLVNHQRHTEVLVIGASVHIYHQLKATEDEFHLYERMQDFARFVFMIWTNRLLWRILCKVAPNKRNHMSLQAIIMYWVQTMIWKTNTLMH